MDNNWHLYVVGSGPIDAAKDILANFVSTLRDQNLRISYAAVIDGTVYGDLSNLRASSGEDGWTVMLMGDGDIAPAYKAFPEFLKQFQGQGITVVDSGVASGQLREDMLPSDLALSTST